jgi:integrase
MPTLPAKGLDRFIATLTWDKALRIVEKEHKARHAKRNQKLKQDAPAPPLKPPLQITFLHYMQRGLSLALVVGFGGTMRFRAITYRNGKPQSWKLGTFPQMSVKAARAAATEYFENPRKIEKQAAVGTFKEIAENWFKRHVKENELISGPEIRRQLEKYVYPKWQDRKFLEIDRHDVSVLQDDISDHHGRAMADYVLATLRSVMTWHQTRDSHYVSPVVKGMRRAKPKARTRILSDNEIRAVWQAVEGAGTFGALVKTLLLTAQRKDKVATMRWDDLSGDEWTIRTKEREKGTAGKLKLPQMVLDVIAGQPRLAGNAYVFAGSTRGRRKHKDRAPGPPTFNSFAKRKTELDGKLELPHWTLHDLRRTARSLMSRAGVQPHIAERVLGHAIAGVEGVYDRHLYDTEKAEALSRLVALVERIVHPLSDNVVAMRPKKPAPAGRNRR